MKLELSETSKLSTIPVLPIMSQQCWVKCCVFAHAPLSKLCVWGGRGHTCNSYPKKRCGIITKWPRTDWKIPRVCKNLINKNNSCQIILFFTNICLANFKLLLSPRLVQLVLKPCLVVCRHWLLLKPRPLLSWLMFHSGSKKMASTWLQRTQQLL